MDDKQRLAEALREFRPEYIRPELLGGFGTPVWAAMLQMLDPMGFSPAQLDRNDAMRGPLRQSALNQRPELLGQTASSPMRPGLHSQAEDLNSVMLKYGNWRKQQVGEPLTPQERVTQGFIDVRNPNSWF
jgi:hypothetical protein